MERTVEPEALRSQLDRRYVLDVRRRQAREASGEQLPGASWKDPDRVPDWIHELPHDREIILYCAHGESISNAVLDALRQNGFSARYVRGGFDGWKAAGGATEPI